MKLYFSIDALSPAANEAWRLQQGGGWRPIQYAEPLQANDARIQDPKEAESLTGQRMQKDKEAVLVPQKKTGIFDFLMRAIYTHAVLHRLSDAPIPDKAQMLDVLRDLEPGHPWLLYLNPVGQFKALDTDHGRIIGNLDIAVRGEIASSPDYIGEQAAQRDDLMDTTYRQFLEGWLEHLNTGKMAVFVPDVEKLNEEQDTLEKIQQWTHE